MTDAELKQHCILAVTMFGAYCTEQSYDFPELRLSLAEVAEMVGKYIENWKDDGGKSV